MSPDVPETGESTGDTAGATDGWVPRSAGVPLFDQVKGRSQMARTVARTRPVAAALRRRIEKRDSAGSGGAGSETAARAAASRGNGRGRLETKASPRQKAKVASATPDPRGSTSRTTEPGAEKRAFASAISAGSRMKAEPWRMR